MLFIFIGVLYLQNTEAHAPFILRVSTHACRIWAVIHV
jgi:hypothetical protein